jgi:hypothetical protein
MTISKTRGHDHPSWGHHSGHENMKNPKPEYFTAGRYTAADLRHLLQRARGHPVPKVTFKKWRYHLGICPDDDLLYTEFDRDALTGLVQWLARGGRIKPYVLQFREAIKEYQNNAQQAS